MNARRPSKTILMAMHWAMLAASLNLACSAKGDAASDDKGSENPDPPGTPPGDGQNSSEPPPDLPPPGNTTAPPDFSTNGKSAIFVDIQGADATLDIDVAGKRATVTAHMDIEIRQPEGGGPLLDLVPAAAQFVTVDQGDKLPLDTVSSPDGTSTMRMVGGTLAPGKHRLDFQYPLKQGTANDGTAVEGIEFAAGGAEFLSNQDDLQLRGFTERYFPSGFEKDRYPFTLTVNVLNAPAGQKPDVMTNGKKEPGADGRSFKITFPQSGSTSSWFLHLIDRNKYGFATGDYKSTDGRTIPLTTYGKKQADADLALSDTKLFLRELETDYGPYPHESLLVSLNGANDPMEYDGAVQTDLDATETDPNERGALGHEILHQWFGRSARPLSGRSGWVDEAIAQWRDDGYRRASSIKLNGKYVTLAVASPYQRHTPEASYDQGSALLQGLDLLMKDRGGLKPVLKEFHSQFRDKFYTTEDFLTFLRQRAPELAEQMEPLFVKKVYAGAQAPTN